jgi:hypothetical protein
MIRTRAAAFFTPCFFVALLLLLLNAAALAQNLPTPPNETKTKNEVTADRPAIEAFITQAVGLLSSQSADEQKRGRDSLVREALVNGQPTASAAYLNAYTQLLNTQLLNLAQNPSTRVRINAAIVTCSVAKLGNLANLAPAAMAFINDSSPAVALWGVKAGAPLVAAQLRVIGGGGPNVAPALVAAAKKHNKGTIGGAIALEAYTALTLSFAPAGAAPVNPQMIAAVVPLLHDLMAFRVGEYRRGIPPEPGADGTGASFLVSAMVWNAQTPPQRVTTMQLLSDLLELVTKQAIAATPPDQNYLAGVTRRLAASISVAASASGDAGLVAAVAPIATAPRGTSAAQMAQMVAAVYPAIKASKTYSAVTAPPTVTGNAPPPPPASAPTTGPVAIPGASALPAVTTRPAGAGAGAAPPTRPTGGAAAPSGTRTPNPRPATRPAAK